MVEVISKEKFEEVIKGDKPVLIDFFATWCGPCKALGPIVEAVQPQYADKLDIYKVDVDNDGEVAAQFGVRGVPTMVIFKDGKPAATKVGALPEDQLKAWIDQALA